MPTFTRNGVELYYELDGAGPPAVYISGLSDHSNSAYNVWLRQTLSQHYSLLSVDNRGAGQTRVAEDARFTIDDMADDVAALLDHHGLHPAHVLGISMGGSIAMTLALNHPDLVRNLALAVTMAHLPSHGRTHFIVMTTREMIDRGVPRDIINRFGAVVTLGDAAIQDEPFIQAWIAAQPEPFEQTSTGFCQQVEAMRQFDIRDRLHEISVPALIFSSPEDTLVPLHHQRELFEHIPHADIRYCPGGHSFMNYPACASQFVNDIFGFWQQN